jgi:hypothetical protein
VNQLGLHFFLNQDNIKGTVSQDFRLLVFFHESVCPKPRDTY